MANEVDPLNINLNIPSEFYSAGCMYSNINPGKYSVDNDLTPIFEDEGFTLIDISKEAASLDSLKELALKLLVSEEEVEVPENVQMVLIKDNETPDTRIFFAFEGDLYCAYNNTVEKLNDEVGATE